MATQEEKQELALFKFGMIAPVVNGTFREESKEAYYREITKEPHILPNGKLVQFAPATIKKWYIKYNRDGLDALVPKSRIDLGRTRALSEDAKKQIQTYLDTFPYITGKKIYEKLIEDRYIFRSDFSVDTLYRYLKNIQFTKEKVTKDDCLAYEFSHANDCWQSDTTMGPIIKAGGKTRQTYLIQAIDDCSRLLVHGELFFEDTGKNVQQVFKRAIQKFGIPKKVFVDNGASFKNHQLKWIFASLGIQIIHSKPYYPQGRGKIERCHRTIKERWLNATDWNTFGSLEDVNSSYLVYLDKEYNNHHHSSINMTPKERYLQDFKQVQFIETSILEEHFLHRITRKVTPSALVSLFNVQYEVPQQYIGKTLCLRYCTDDMSQIYIYDESEGKQLHSIRPVNKVDNQMRSRKTKIDYGKMR
jgi:transposase InsO family protein